MPYTNVIEPEDEKRIEAQVVAVLHPMILADYRTENAIRAAVQQTIAILEQEEFLFSIFEQHKLNMKGKHNHETQ